MNSPAYQLRPNKYVDRNLFCETLKYLTDIVSIPEYRYIGFGSYGFDDYKLLYRTFGIKDMHSIECFSEVFKRQQFNCPFDFIKLFHKKSSDYIDEDFDQDINSIVWLDYSDASDKASQFKDIANLFSKIQAYDIVRVTLNANSSSIKTASGPTQLSNDEKRAQRVASLKDSLSDYIPEDVNEADVSNDGFPYLLLRILKNAVYKGLRPELSVCPICSYVYSDGQQMITSTMLVLETSELEGAIEALKEKFKNWFDYVTIGSWESFVKIKIPTLTVLEQIELGKIINNDEEIKESANRLGLNINDIKQYHKYLRYCPNYQPVLM